MDSYHTRNNAIINTAYRCVDRIIKSIVHLPGGVPFWYGLPKKELYNTRKVKIAWKNIILEECFNDHLVKSMVLSVFDHYGKPTLQGRFLYNWLLHNIYHNSVKALYSDWLQVKDQVNLPQVKDMINDNDSH